MTKKRTRVKKNRSSKIVGKSGVLKDKMTLKRFISSHVLECIVGVVLVACVVVIATYVMSDRKVDKPNYHIPYSDTMLSSGKFINLDNFDNQVYVPDDMEEETPARGGDYSRLWVKRRENGTPRYMFGIIQIPNESNISYNISQDVGPVRELSENAVSNAISDVYGGLRPSISADIERQTLFEAYDSVVESGFIKVNLGYMEFTSNEENPDEVNYSYIEEPIELSFYSQTIVYEGQPTVVWGAWEWTVPLATIDVKQSAVDCLASFLGQPTVNMNEMKIDKREGPDTKIVWDDSLEHWVVDSTGEVLENIPKSSDPSFMDEYQKWIASLNESDDGEVSSGSSIVEPSTSTSSDENDVHEDDGQAAQDDTGENGQ